MDLTLAREATGEFANWRSRVLCNSDFGFIHPIEIVDVTAVLKESPHTGLWTQDDDRVLIVYASDEQHRVWYIEVVMGDGTRSIAFAPLNDLTWKEFPTSAIKRYLGMEPEQLATLVRELIPTRIKRFLED
jgi:hypothetical protein